ncbi:MAG: hypothetical protein LBJ00_04620 [Planctomycetaceae bacterium]|nr:hypothetical protein [Planctomycetaceae bacterium]
MRSTSVQKKGCVGALCKILHCVVFFACSMLSASDHISLEEAINGYERYLRSLMPLVLEFEETVGNEDSVGKVKSNLERTMGYDGSNFIVRSRLMNDSRKYRHEFSYHNGRLLLVYRSLLPDDELSLISWLNPTADDIDFGKNYNYLPNLLGYFAFDKVGVYDYIPSVLKKYPNNITIKQETPASQVVITMTIKDILFEIVFDNGINFMPIRYKLVRKNNFSQLVSMQMYSCECVFENYRSNFPKRYLYSAVYATVGEDGRQGKVEFSRDVTFRKVSINVSLSKSDFEITEPVPNYTEVFMQDAPQVKYVWLDGKIVPYTDELAMAQLRGHKFMPGVNESRFWVMAVGILMITIALGFKIRGFFYNNRQKKDN